MSLDDKFIPIRTAISQLIGNFFKKIAGLLGHPKNLGMPTIYDILSEVDPREEFINNLPNHKTFWPPLQKPETWFETIFGPAPKIETLPRYLYENKEEGFYNFYIENYRNLYFLPNWLSEFIQVRLNICLDISLLENIREALFIGLMVYSQIVIFRITLSWFLSINPYRIPWCYFTAAVDWTEDILQGLVPGILGVNVTGSICLGMFGVMGDSLNHLVFTMPFLPSEGEQGQLLINEEMKDVLIFHYLPISWYRYPIPNQIREFWYYERPEILDYMQTSYKDLNISLLPDNIIQEFNQQNHVISYNTNISKYISPEVMLKEDFFSSIQFINSINENFHNFFLTHVISYMSNLF